MRSRGARLAGGGGGIRTHEGLRPAGFQDRSHQPLDHPSSKLVEPATTLAHRVTARQIFREAHTGGWLARNL